MKCFLNSFERPSAISLTGIPEVFVETMAFGFLMASMRVIRSALIFKFSTMASMTQSASAMTPKSSSRFPSVTNVFNSDDIKFAGLALIQRSQPSLTILLRAALSPSGAPFGTISSNVTGTPALARCAAKDAPMVPEPITTALCM